MARADTALTVAAGSRAVWMLLAASLAAVAAGSEFGRFEGTVQAEWLPDGRNMRLLADFLYVDSKDEKWLAPKGATVDGASIPRVFWVYVGGPFEGKYRNASVVHDVACVERKRPWKDVHRMFYHASRLGGVGRIHALVMYGAVYHFGPRWPDSHTSVSSARPMRAAYLEWEARELTTDEDFLRMRAYIHALKGDITLEQIEALTSEFLMEAVPEIPRA